MHDDHPAYLIDSAAAAKYLGISQRHLHRLVKDGSIPSVKLGNRRMYTRESLRQWVDAQLVTAQPGDEDAA